MIHHLDFFLFFHSRFNSSLLCLSDLLDLLAFLFCFPHKEQKHRHILPRRMNLHGRSRTHFFPRHAFSGNVCPVNSLVPNFPPHTVLKRTFIHPLSFSVWKTPFPLPTAPCWQFPAPGFHAAPLFKFVEFFPLLVSNGSFFPESMSKDLSLLLLSFSPLV